MSRRSPEQNASEQLNRTVWDRVRPIILASGLGVSYLPPAVQYAFHVRNLFVVPDETLRRETTLIGRK